MKIILAIIFVFAVTICQGQTDTIVDNITFHYISRFEDGQIKELGNFMDSTKNIIKNGYWIRMNQDGTINEKGEYKKNKKIGSWFENGATGIYKNGKKNGEWFTGTEQILYYKKGKLKYIKYVFYQ